MEFRSAGMLALAAAAAAAPLAAQNPPAAATERTVIAQGRLATVTAVPLHFKVLSVTIPAGGTSSVAVGDGILYQMSGTTDVTLGGQTTTVAARSGLMLPAGQTAQLRAGAAEPSTFLHFFLAPASAVDGPTESAPATVQELYRTPAPIPDLRAGPYDINLTRVTFPAGMPSNAPHHRSGGAVYYIVSGSGVQTVDGVGTLKPTGSVIYEPMRLVHQWGNPGTEPMTFLAFNINPEGVAAVLQGAPPP